MKFRRRDFLKGLTAAFVAVPALRYAEASDKVVITVLHTNDTHSQIEPFPQGVRNAGMGGAARRAAFVKRVREENPNTLLIDGGDYFQGSPYFNFYQGEVEIKAMNAIGYDAATLGNHEFDNGVESLARALKNAKFDVVSANYDVSASLLKDLVKPYVVKTLSGIRVGIFGMGVDFEGLVTPDKHVGVVYRDPIECARKTALKLRNEEKVDLVLAASHLGLRFADEPNRVSDLKVAAAVSEIDFIASGHTHTFMKEPEFVKHENGRQTIVFQVGMGGVNVGRVDFVFSGKKLVSSNARLIETENA